MNRSLLDDLHAFDFPAGSDDSQPLERLRLHQRDALDVALLRRMLQEEGELRGIDRMSDQDVIRAAARLMARGRLARVGRLPDVYGGRDGRSGTFREAAGKAATQAASQAAPPPEREPPAEKETTWVEIELVDERGEPVAGEAYWVRTASGEAITGRLDPRGRARVNGVEPGTCQVTFPNLNSTDWAKA